MKYSISVKLSLFSSREERAQWISGLFGGYWVIIGECLYMKIEFRKVENLIISKISFDVYISVNIHQNLIRIRISWNSVFSLALEVYN